jgi:hypothetical protein
MNDLVRAQRLLTGHGALVLLAAFVIGFGLLFFLLGEIKVWPIPGVINYQLPGTYDAWRMAHMEGVVNGLGLWILAAVLPVLQLSGKAAYRLAVGMIIVSWTFVIASVLDPVFPNARGLAFTHHSNLASDIAFFLFYIGIAIAFAVVITVAIRSFKNNNDSQ